MGVEIKDKVKAVAGVFGDWWQKAVKKSATWVSKIKQTTSWTDKNKETTSWTDKDKSKTKTKL